MTFTKKFAVSILAAALMFTLAFALCFALCQTPGVASAQDRGSDLYWSEHNAPVFYGATGITLSKNAIDEFDIKDSRFRLFAKDFEDGDLESAIRCEGASSVRPHDPGTYELHYSVTDSHHNTSELDVSVTVTDDENAMITVERTMYLIPNDWNMTVAGFSRCNGGDRQILGIFLPDGASFEMKVLSSEEELRTKCGISALTIAMLNDDARRETAVTVPVNPSEAALANDGYTVVTNEYTADDKASDSVPGNYANVPFMSSNKLLRGEDVNSTFKFEIRYNANEAHRLNYYHFGDNGGGLAGEQAFTESWKQSADSHGVLENEVLTVLVPIEDIDKLHSKDNNGNPSAGFVFEHIDAFLTYYKNVVDRMDSIVGLDFDPKKATDQNLRAKYLVKANAHGAGAAYYAGNHVGINSKVADPTKTNGWRGQMYAFFQMNWGGLHEIAHGYQGGLGSGSMGLGEVSNNILGYYIQQDEDLYTYRGGGTWLGDIHNVANETSRNSLRLSESDPQGLLDMKDASVAVGVKLYFLVNLFEAFDKEETYAKLFSLYREERAAGKNVAQEDFYVHFFAQEYDANVLPYFEQWGVSVSDEVVEEASRASKCYSVLADSAGDKLDEIVEEKGKTQRFGLVEDGELAQYGMTGSFAACADSTLEKTIAEGRTLLLTKGDETVAQARMNNGVALFENVPTGTYTLRLPTIGGYRATNVIATVENGKQTSANFKYSPFDGEFYQTQIYIAGIRETLGWSIDITSSKEGQIKNGAADLGNQNQTWRDKPNETYMSVVIKDASGKTIWQKDVKGAEYFDYADPNETVALDVGYTVSITTPKPQLVYVYSLANGKDKNSNRAYDLAEGYSSGKTNELVELVFEITKTGLMPRYKEDFDVNEEMFGTVKQLCEEDMNELKEYFEQNPQSLDKKYLDRSKKDEFESWYKKMDEQSRAPYDELYEKMTRGGLPEATQKSAQATAKDVDSIDWNEFLEVFDAEDGKLDLNAGNLEYKANGDLKKKGTYSVELYAYDSDGNKTQTYVVTLNISQDAREEGLSPLAIGLICAAGGIVLIATAFVVALALKGKKKNAGKRRADA